MIITNKDWETLEKMNQTLIQKWEALTHTRKQAKKKEIIAAEMQYLSALQNLHAVVQVAVSPVGKKREMTQPHKIQTPPSKNQPL